MSKKDDVMFIGGFCGISKKSGKNFYSLSFAVRPRSDRPDHFGFENATVFTDSETFKRFSMCQPMSYVDALLNYSRGGWDLISYNL